MARNMISNHICSDRPLPTCKTSIVVTAKIFAVFNADEKETTKEVVAAEGRHFCTCFEWSKNPSAKHNI